MTIYQRELEFFKSFLYTWLDIYQKSPRLGGELDELMGVKAVFFWFFAYISKTVTPINFSLFTKIKADKISYKMVLCIFLVGLTISEL